MCVCVALVHVNHVSRNQKVVQHVRFKVFAVIQLRPVFFWFMVLHFWVTGPMKNSSLYFDP